MLLQIKALYDLKEKFHIDVNIDKDKGMVLLYGTKDYISAASDVYHEIIRDKSKGIYNQIIIIFCDLKHHNNRKY